MAAVAGYKWLFDASVSKTNDDDKDKLSLHSDDCQSS
jgi:hypothetical protein